MIFAKNKLIVSAVIFTVVTLCTLFFAIFKNNEVEHSLVPAFVDPINQFSPRNSDFIKISQKSGNKDDMRSTLYLTQHRYLLEEMSNLQVQNHEKSYSVSDICYKPHYAIFKQFDSEKNVPPHFQRLLLEIRRLSPCLIATPLNCFHDSYQVHSQMSKWSSDVDFLNRRLRNAYIEAQGENETRPYVKSDYAPELVEKWAEIMFQLKSEDDKSFNKKELRKRVEIWLKTIKPQSKFCVDSRSSCDQGLMPEDYHEACNAMQQDNTEKLKLKIQIEDEDKQFLAGIDCVEDLEKFIEWMQEKDLRALINPENRKTDQKNIIHQRCEGIYHISNSSGNQFFDGYRSFGSETSSFDTMKLELVLMKPELLLATMMNSDFVNGFESIWTLERAKKLLKDARGAIREKINDFNNRRLSQRLNVMTRTTEEPAEVDSITYKCLYIFTALHIIIVLHFIYLVWVGNRVRSTLMFVVRNVITSVLFMTLFRTNGAVLLDSALLYHAVLLTVVNLFLTTRVSFCVHRLWRCIQRANDYLLRSNFSSVDTVPVDSVNKGSDPRLIHYTLARYTKFQAAQDTYSEEQVKELPNNAYIFSLLFLPISFLYCTFVDSDLHKVLVIILPSLVIAAAEENWETKNFLRERKAVQDRRKMNLEEKKRLLSRETVDNLFAGNNIENKDEEREKETDNHSSVVNIPTPHTKNFGKLSNSTYNVNIFSEYSSKTVNFIRFSAITMYFRVLKSRKMSFLIPVLAFLFVFVAAGLLVVPIQRISIASSVFEDDVLIEFSINKASSRWENLNKHLDEFNVDMDSIGNLQTISNWRKAFKRFDKNFTNLSDPAILYEWIEADPINWAVSAHSMNISNKLPLPEPFTFSFRYFLKELQETAITEVVSKIDETLDKYSSELNPKASGVLYEHYHAMAVLWDSFVLREILSTSFLLPFLVLVAKLFSINPTGRLLSVFSFFVVGTRIEAAAVVSLFSLEGYHFYTTLAVLIGFIASWTPFCESARFLCRVEHFQKTKTAPELKSGRRIRVPFIAVADIALFFAILLTVSIGFATTCAIFAELNILFVPTVIFIGIQVFALVNSFAIILSMFEKEVKLLMQSDLCGSTTAANICDITHKIPHESAEEVSIQMEEFSIQPSAPLAKYFAPPPRKPTNKRGSDSDDADDEGDGSVSPKQQRSSDMFAEREGGMGPEAQKFLQTYPPFVLERQGLIPNAALCTLSGMPVDSSYRIADRQAIIQRAEENYEAGEFDQEEFEDDLLNSGDINDREPPIAIRQLLAHRERALGQLDDPNVPGPSNRLPMSDQNLSFDNRDPLQNPQNQPVRTFLEEYLLQNNRIDPQQLDELEGYRNSARAEYARRQTEGNHPTNALADLIMNDDRGSESPPPLDPNYQLEPDADQVHPVLRLAAESRRQQRNSNQKPNPEK